MDFIFKHVSLESQKYPLIYNLNKDMDISKAMKVIKKELNFYKKL